MTTLLAHRTLPERGLPLLSLMQFWGWGLGQGWTPTALLMPPGT